MDEVSWSPLENLWTRLRDDRLNSDVEHELKGALKDAGAAALILFKARAPEIGLTESTFDPWLNRNGHIPGGPTATPVEVGDRESKPLIGDLTNAERLVDQHGADLRYCHPWRKWLVWDAVRWKIDDTGAVRRFAKETVRSIYQEAANLADEGLRKAVARWAQQSESESRIEAMISLAATEASIPILPDELDKDLWLLNCPNGTFDLKEGVFREHRREDLLTKVTGAPYDALAEAPLWKAFLEHIFERDRERIGFVKRMAGYSLTGDVRERVMATLYGGGRNGKTTLVEAQADAMGDYALRTPTETFFARKDNSIPNDKARLRGSRFVYASEGEEGRRLAEAFIKDATGGDTISARFLHGEWFEFKPTFKLWLSTNHKPEIRGTDSAIWDRIRLIPFNVRISDEELDPLLSGKLKGELSGILTWLIEGCMEWAVSGLGNAPSIEEATKSYREEMDILATFLEECCVLHPQASVPRVRLHKAYIGWCEQSSERALDNTKFNAKLRERGIEEVRHGQTGRFWRGLGLLVDTET